MHTIKQTLGYFKDPRLLVIFCFGIASGYPWVMIGSAMSAWLKDEGFSRSSIGLFGLIFVAYSINFLWSPLLDRIKLPLLTARLGIRRSWILLTQSIILLACLWLSQVTMQQSLTLLAALGLIIAIAGATQDIAIDAYRIDRLGRGDSELMAAGSAMATSGWWTGYAGLGSIPFILVSQPNWQWPQVYMVLAGFMALLMLVVFVVKEPNIQRSQTLAQIEQNYLAKITHGNQQHYLFLVLIGLIISTIVYANIGYPFWPDYLATGQYRLMLISFIIVLLMWLAIQQLIKLNRQSIATDEIKNAPISGSQRFTAWLLTTMVAPIDEFFNRNGKSLAISILLFIFLFKLGEAYLGRMSIVFYKELGFSNEDIAYYSKMINWGVTIVFSLIGSAFTIRFGILKGLFIGGIAMSSSNLLFALMAQVGPDKTLFAITVLVDGFTSAWGSVAFVALLSVLCNHTFTASQYALMASLGTFGRVMLGSYSGVIVDSLNGNWSLFFILTSLMVIPSLMFLYRIRKPLQRLIEQQQITTKEGTSG